ncbi:MAG: hypothetical protein ACLQMO_04145 [Acidobacteriaceae bacterium]
MKKPAFTLAFGCGWILLDDEMVEAAGVEPVISTENTQVTETENALNFRNSTIAWFAYKSRTKNSLNSQNSNSWIFQSVQRTI